MMKHKHHIIPKHMGGSNDPSNLVELTIEEHAEAHKKLWETFGKEEDRLAWLGLSEQISKSDILIQIKKSDEYKKKHKEAVNSPEYKKKMSERFSGEKHPMYGKKHNDESKEKIKQARKLQVFSKETIAKRNKSVAKPIMTPDGFFESRKLAAQYYGLDESSLNYRMRIKPLEYYYIKKVKTK